MNKLQISVISLIAAMVFGVEILPWMAKASLPAAGPQYFTVHLSCSGSGTCKVAENEEVTIPAGKRIFMQYVSAAATVDGLAPQQVMVRLTVPYFEGSSTCGSFEYGVPVMWEGVIAGKSRFSGSATVSLIAAPPEQTCSVGKGIGAYVNSTSSSLPTTLNVHISGYVQ